MKDTFPPSALRPLAHELRNAIAPVRNAAHLLRKRAAGDPIVATALQTINAAVDQSLRLLDRAVDAERVMRGEVAISTEEVDVATLVQRAVDASAAAVSEKKQRVRVDVPPSAVHVRADASRLVQALATLIDNASRYSDEGSDIDVVVQARVDDAVVRVRDRGAGIPATFLPRVFEPFARDDAQQAHGASVAMSLPVARRLVELHQGRLDATSAGPGCGSEFVVTLPRAGARPGQPEQTDAPAADAGAPSSNDRARRVLLVDDNRAVRETYADVLADLGCEVETAADGEQAIARALDSRPRFVILDINLPKRNGYEVARTLRARFPRHEMTLVMISGTLLDDSTLAMARAAGFDHCLDKAGDLPILERLLAAD